MRSFSRDLLAAAVVPSAFVLLAVAGPGPAGAQEPTSRPAAAPTAAAPRPVGSPAGTPGAEAADDSKARAACEAHAKAILGQSKDPQALNDPGVRAMALSNADLVICSAVLNDSDALCKRFYPNDSGPSGACLQLRAVFHELRTQPQKRTFMFDDRDWQQCRGIEALGGFCDSLRAALRSGDPKECAKVVDAEGICRAYMTGDKSLCAVTGKLAETEFSLPDQKEGEPASYKVADIAVEDCRAKIDSRGFLAQGLEKIAASGPAREQQLAKAALKKPDACQPMVEQAVTLCLNAQQAPAPGPTAAGGAPQAPKP